MSQSRERNGGGQNFGSRSVASRRTGPGGGPRPFGPAAPKGEEDEPHWVWGLHAALAALNNPHRKILRVCASRNAAVHLPEGLAHELIDPSSLEGQLPVGAVHQGLAVRVEPLKPLELEEACQPVGGVVLMLDGVTDPQNVGAAFRSAAAFGARAVILQDRRSPGLTGTLTKAAAGAVDVVPHVRVANLANALGALKLWGYTTIALTGDAPLSLDKTLSAGPTVLVVGAEGKGVRPSVAAACDFQARIDIDPRMESLNVAAAAAIALHEARRLIGG